jgi:ATP/maltotriose-dependent transcriptional regulator MalT/DNA-binding SARP family transcriptional activator
MAAPNSRPSRTPSRPVDIRSKPFVSFAPPDTDLTAAEQPNGERTPTTVDPRRPVGSVPIPAQVTPRDVNAFPVQLSKVQRPVLRDETLARDRLLDWLSAKIHHRLVLVTAEAGYGKTTLLADFSRRTRLRVLWYRLDESDRDWITVLNTLVAAGRAVDPTFALATASLLGEVSSGSMASGSMATVLETFVRDLQAFGGKGGVLILDDYHVVEDVPDVQRIMREVVVRAPERLTIVILSRRAPHLPIARLRALGEVAELTRDDLRFDADETERLFRETYGRPLEADVLAELGRHTEGWAASLQLVQSALRERTMSETRTFVRGLSGSQGTLHDYLAEEVVGDLSTELQSFLMRTSILTSISPAASSIVAGDSVDEAEAHLEAAERLGLLPRVDRTSGAYRYHNLVREFLEDRLRREVGADGIAALHRRMAAFGETIDWKLAAHHYAAAGDIDELRRVLVGSIQDIMGGGGFALAEFYVTRHPELEPDPSFGLFLSRRDLYRGDYRLALERAAATSSAFPPDNGSHIAHLALQNLGAIHQLVGNVEEGVALAERLEALEPELSLRAIARATIAIGRETLDGDLRETAGALKDALAIQVARGQSHYQGITYLNLALNAQARGVPEEALEHATKAIEILGESSAGSEMLTPYVTRSWALLQLGHAGTGVLDVPEIRQSTDPWRNGVLIEMAELEAAFGDPESARMRAVDFLPRALSENERDVCLVLLADLASRAGNHDLAVDYLSAIGPPRRRATPAFHGRLLLAQAQVHLRAGGSWERTLDESLEVLRRQGANYWLIQAEITSGLARLKSDELNGLLVKQLGASPAYASLCAEDISRRFGELGPDALKLVTDEAERRPERWRPVLRSALDRGERSSAAVAAAILDKVGERGDIALLRSFARSHRSPSSTSLGRGLARRLAEPARIGDLGHVVIQIGERSIDGSSVRRKVLALICFLLTKPGFTATRDQVLDALWPDLDPEVAVNSLNQTVYFLRRVFEPNYREDESANYVLHDGEVVRLDQELVSSQSGHCRSLIDRIRGELDPPGLAALSRDYQGRFALDFEYEDWSSPFRETLHAAYLDVVEQAVTADTAAGRFEQAGLLARRALELDPDAESVEEALLTLYRRSGSHAAAAEQLSRYGGSSPLEQAGTPQTSRIDR